MRGGLLTTAAINHGEVLAPDSYSYRQLAGSLHQRHEFSRDGEPEIFRTPGYPVFLALIQWLHGGIWTALTAQVLLDVGLVMITFHLAAMLAGREAGALAALIQAVTPVAIASCCRMLSDSLYALLLTGSVVLVVGHLRGGGWKHIILSGVTMAAGCYVRPVGVAMAAMAGLVILLSSRKFLHTMVFIAIVAMCLAPWVVRNAVIADYRGFSSFAGDSLYRFSAAEVIAREENVDVQTVRGRLDREVAAANLPTPGARSRYRMQRAAEIIRGNPGDYLIIHTRGDLAFWLPGATDVLEVAGVTAGQKGTLSVLHQKGLMSAAKHYFAGSPWAVIAAGALVSIFAVKMIGVATCVLSRARLKMSAAAWLMVLVVGTSAMAGGPASTPRFRVPVASLLSVAAAVGWLRLSRGRRRKQRC